AENSKLLKPGMAAFLPGDGEGRNGVWLAERGLRVTSVDASPVGVEKAQNLAASRGVTIKSEVADLRDWEVPAEKFDVVVLAFLHVGPGDSTAVHRKLAQTLKPGGLMLLEGFTPDHLGYGKGGPKDTRMMFTEDGLRADFDDLLDIEYLETFKTELPASERHGGPAVVIRLRARRKGDI
ncbi:MAG: class I SAM-dependent methyltransferase, partial [Alphaproteobacteria bacterium]